MLVIGGGFYGAVIAAHLALRREPGSVMLVERESSLLLRASYNNQARVHNGYHYPRSFTTAYRSRINLPRFVQDWPESVTRNFTQIYAIARHNTRTTAAQFLRFCRDIGAAVEPVETEIRSLFDRRLIEDVFRVEEYAFDATALSRAADEKLRSRDVEVRLNTQATAISREPNGHLQVELALPDGKTSMVRCALVVNCTYSSLNRIGGDFPGTRTPLKHEIAEIALLRPPNALLGLGVTVMDGPFFSLMPFPARALHSLSHVRYTPHLHWTDTPGIDPRDKLECHPRQSRVDRMQRDAARYMPALLEASYVESLFEVKTVLAKNECDDGRPILFDRHDVLPGCYSVLGGKIDNVYDVLEKLDEELSRLP